MFNVSPVGMIQTRCNCKNNKNSSVMLISITAPYSLQLLDHVPGKKNQKLPECETKDDSAVISP